MAGTTDLPGKQTLDDSTLAADSKHQDVHVAQTRRRARRTLWVVGLVTLLAVSVIVHFHPAPWPYEVQTTTTMQQLQLWPWLITPIIWASIVDNPIPSTVGLIAWFVVLSLIGVVVWRRGGSPIPWFVTAIFLSLGTGLMDGLNALIGYLVARPRPTSPPIHVYMPEHGIPSFPSGHVENDLVYYGFLLYLSFTKPVSQWRSRWILIPFQVYAALNILFIGYSRVLEGSHWLDDALAGYLAGALWLALLIFLYRWTLDVLTKRRTKRVLEQSEVGRRPPRN
jgi:membrane-associated phospholipid phosphatase